MVNNKWVAWVAVIALIVAVVALVIILTGGMTGNAVLTKTSLTAASTPVYEQVSKGIIINKGETKTITLNNKLYKVSLNAVWSDGRVEFLITEFDNTETVTGVLIRGNVYEGNCFSIAPTIITPNGKVYFNFHSWC